MPTLIPVVGKEVMIFATKEVARIVRAHQIAPGSNDPYNWQLTLDNGEEVTGLDWRIYRPEQYLKGATRSSAACAATSRRKLSTLSGCTEWEPFADLAVITIPTMTS